MINLRLITIDDSYRMFYFCHLCGKEIIKDGITPFIVYGNHVQYAHTQCMEELFINYKQVVKDNEYERLLCILDNKLYNTLVKFKRRKLYTWLRTHCADVKRYLDKKK
jgi:hypothetical protein